AFREVVHRLTKQGGLSDPARLQIAQALLTQRKGEWLESLLTKRRVKLHVYHFSGRAARIADVTEPQELDAAIQAIQRLRAEGESTQLGTAVQQVLNDFRGYSLAAVIALTDGITMEGKERQPHTTRLHQSHNRSVGLTRKVPPRTPTDGARRADLCR